jgi:hypothetical protein
LRLTHYKTLKCVSARTPLCIIWRHSGPYKKRRNEEELGPPFISMNALGASLWEEEEARLWAAHLSGCLSADARRMQREDDRKETFASQKQYVRRASRLVEAAVTYGLVEMKRLGKRGLHIDGTEVLDEMMIRIEAMQMALAGRALEALLRVDHNESEGREQRYG